MHGLELSKKYFYECAYPILQEKFEHILGDITVGLVGEGSDCFGFDDNYSMDHDWGAGFCIWLSDESYRNYAKSLQEFYNLELPSSYCGYSIKTNPINSNNRVGVISTSQFYYQFIGNIAVPKNNIAWLYAPIHAYACVTNGEIFYGENTDFIKTRNVLLKGYPKDVRNKKLASQVATMGQSGQYNYVRCLKRGDNTGAFLAKAEFIKSTANVVHLLNNAYTPFYKWIDRSIKKQEKLSFISEYFEKLLQINDEKKSIDMIEFISCKIKDELLVQKLSDGTTDFLVHHAENIMKKIEDEEIRSLPLFF